MSSTIHDRFIDQAKYIKIQLEERVNAAMTYVNDALGFDAWSRNLHDDQQVFAFLLPQEVYINKRLRDKLWNFIKNVFYAHFLSVEESHLMPDSSNDGINEECEPYIVDWYGSRSRNVKLGPHFNFRIVFDGWIGRPIEDPQPPSLQVDGVDLAWDVQTEDDSCYETRQWATLRPSAV